MTTDDRKRLRELAQAATPGPWTTTILGPSDDDWPSAVAIAATAGRRKIYANPLRGTYPHADQQFIAAANPQAVLALLDRLAASERASHEAEQLAESRFAWAQQVEERIAAFIDADTKRLADSYVQPSAFGRQLAIDIRAGAWRTKGDANK